MSEIFENNSIEAEASTLSIPNEQDARNSLEAERNLLSSKYRLFKEAHDVYYKYLITLLVFEFASVISRFVVDKIADSRSPIAVLFSFLLLLIMFIPAILLLVFFFSYISKAKKIGKFTNNKKLTSSATLQLTGIIGLFVSVIVFVISILAFLISMIAKYYDNIATLIYNLRVQSSFLAGFLSLIITYFACIIAFSITLIVGQFKEYTGYIVEVSSIDSALVDSFKLAKTWFTVSFILNLILGFVYSIIVNILNISSPSNDIGYLLISFAVSIIAFVALYYKFKALKHAVAVLESKTNIQ